MKTEKQRKSASNLMQKYWAKIDTTARSEHGRMAVQKRNEKATPEQRSEWARNAALKRWKKL